MHLCAKQRPGNSSIAHQEALLSSSPAKFNANLCENFSTGSFIFRAPWILCILKFKFYEKVTNISSYDPLLFYITWFIFYIRKVCNWKNNITYKIQVIHFYFIFWKWAQFRKDEVSGPFLLQLFLGYNNNIWGF